MQQVKNLEYNEKNLNILLERRLAKNDLEGALSVAYRMQENGVKKSKVFKIIADLYFDMKLYEKSIEFWFKFLNEEGTQKAVGYNGLGASYYKLGDNDLAGYYFHLQLKVSKTTILKYNEIGAEFFNEITDKSKDFYLAYPYEKADFTKLLNEVTEDIKEGNSDLAIQKLEIIPKNSKYYQDGLIQKAIAYFFKDDKENSLKTISLAVENNPNDLVTLCNAISMYNHAENNEKVNELLSQLLKIDFYSESEDLSKAFMIFCETDSYNKAEEYGYKYLKNNPYDLPVIQLLAITEFNLKKYENAEKLFLKYFRLTKSKIPLFYLNFIENSKNKKRVQKLNYTFSVPYNYISGITTELKEYISKEFLTEEEFLTLIELSETMFETRSYSNQELAFNAIKKLPFNVKLEYYKEYFLSTNLFHTIKNLMIYDIVLNGYSGKINIVFDGIFKQVDILKVQLKGKTASVFLKAYANLYSRLVSVESELTVIRDTCEELNCLFFFNEDILVIENYELLEDINSLSAVIFEYSKVKEIRSRRDFAKFFNAKLKNIKQIKEIIDDLKNTNTKIQSEIATTK